MGWVGTHDLALRGRSSREGTSTDEEDLVTLG